MQRCSVNVHAETSVKTRGRLIFLGVTCWLCGASYTAPLNEMGNRNIGATQNFDAVYMKLLIKEFSTHFPNTKFEVQELLVPDIEDKLQNSVLDIGFSYFPAKHPLIEEHILYTEELVAMALAGQVPDKPISFKSLCAYLMALPNQNTQTRRIIDEHARQSGASINPVFESNIIHTNIELARELNLVTIASRDQCQRVDGMVVLNIKDKMPMRQTCVIFRKNAHRTKLLQKFMDLAVEITNR